MWVVVFVSLPTWMYIGKKSFRKWQLYCSTFWPWTSMATLFADVLAFSWLHLFTMTCLLWLDQVQTPRCLLPLPVCHFLYRGQDFIFQFLTHQKPLGADLLLGNVSGQSQHQAEQGSRHHQGWPPGQTWICDSWELQQVRAAFKKFHLLCHGYKPGSPQCSELRVVRSLLGRETRKSRYFY